MVMVQDVMFLILLLIIVIVLDLLKGCHCKCDIYFDVWSVNINQTGTCNNLVCSSIGNNIRCCFFNLTQPHLSFVTKITSDVQNQCTNIKDNLGYHYNYITSVSSTVNQNIFTNNLKII